LKNTHSIAPLLLLVTLGLAACQAGPQPSTGPAATQTAIDLLTRAALAELAKGHSDKMQLGWYASSPFRHVDPAIKQFAQDMRTTQDDLHHKLKTWADAHRIDLAIHYNPADPRDIARQAMEKQQGDSLQADSNIDFQRDVIILMYMYYQNQLSLIQALIPRIHDPELKAYLEQSQRVHTAALKSLRDLLGRYKLQ